VAPPPEDFQEALVQGVADRPESHGETRRARRTQVLVAYRQLLYTNGLASCRLAKCLAGAGHFDRNTTTGNCASRQ